MMSKNCSSKGLLLDTMRRESWALVLSGVGFCLTLLLPTLMSVQKALSNRAENLSLLSQEAVEHCWKGDLSAVSLLLGGQNPLVKAMFLILAVVCGVALFAYLHDRRKVDHFHSMPISRTALFVNNLLTGIISTLLTYAVVLAVTLVCVFAMGCGEAVQWSAVGGAVVCHVVVFLLVYALAVLTTVLCGNTIVSLLLLVWVLFGPLLIYVLQQGVFSRSYDTFVSTDLFDGQMKALRLSPVVEYFELNGLYHDTYAGEARSAVGLLAVYLVLAVLVAVLAALLFRIRRSERAGTALAFEPTKLPIKVVMCLTIGTTFGLVFDMIADGFWFWVGLVVGTVLFHWVVEIIYAFDLHAIFAKPVHLAAILAVLLAVMLGVRYDVTGYDRWLPDRDKLTAVDIDNIRAEQLPLTTPDNIDAVYRLAELGVESTQAPEVKRDSTIPYDGSTVRLVLSFGMGDRIERRAYDVIDTDEVQALRAQIMQSEEYKRARWPLFRFKLEPDGDRQPMIEIYTNADRDSSAGTITDQQALTQVVETLREESLRRSEDSRPVLRLTLYYQNAKGDRYYEDNAYVTEADRETLALIEQLTGVTPQPISSDTVKCVLLQYLIRMDDHNERWETVEVTDRADIDALLANAIDEEAMQLWGYEPEYSIRVAQRRWFAVVAVVAGQYLNGTRTLRYMESELPTAIVQKYLPAGVELDASGNSLTATANMEAASIG
ncbi:MAG: hypothetical protein Q4D31_02320 [Eubacteriales bacterium]|nr:hypothetical protein [Eubacteriales bacterium]